ncbi:Replication protein 15 [Burkholderia pseudomallei]|nr:Replication protein 15 [Burkholderia pseudomallei]
MKIKAQDGDARAPFSMLETRMWADEKFVKLSRFQPSGQALWVYLLTGPHTLQTRMVPGVYVIGRAAIAEALHWSLEEFDACFREIFGRKMAEADWDRQILWLPNVLKRHLPRSPDNVRAWRVGWDLIPDCALKRKIHRAIKPIIARNEHFARAFDEALKPVPHGFATDRKTCKKADPSEEPSANHKRTISRTMRRTIREPSADPSPEPNADHRRTIDDPSPNQIKDVRCEMKDKDNPKVKGVNGAPAPLTPRVRVREREAEPERPKAPPDKRPSEFASVRRFEAMAKNAPTQGELLDDDARKPAPDKDRAEDGSADGSDMGSPMVVRKGRGKSRKAASEKAPGPDTAPTWAAYSEAYVARYGVEPIRNAIVNSQMLHFVERVGVAEAPEIARFFVRHGNGYYVRRSHAVGLLLQDAESVRTQWATQRPMTATEAAMIDRTATNANAFAPLIAEARERERNEAEHGN